jgi:hypothetical protein
MCGIVWGENAYTSPRVEIQVGGAWLILLRSVVWCGVVLVVVCGGALCTRLQWYVGGGVVKMSASLLLKPE